MLCLHSVPSQYRIHVLIIEAVTKQNDVGHLLPLGIQKLAYNQARLGNLALQEPQERHILNRKSHPLLSLGGMNQIRILDKRKRTTCMPQRVRYV